VRQFAYRADFPPDADTQVARETAVGQAAGAYVRVTGKDPDSVPVTRVIRDDPAFPDRLVIVVSYDLGED